MQHDLFRGILELAGSRWKTIWYSTNIYVLHIFEWNGMHVWNFLSSNTCKETFTTPQKRTYEVDQTAKISDFILKQKNQTCSLSVIRSGTVNLKSISFEIKHQLKAKHTLLHFSKLHLFSSDKSITQAGVKAFVLVKGPLSPLDVSVGSFFRQISPR